MNYKIIIVDDEVNIRQGLKRALIHENYDIDLASSADSVIEMLKKRDYNVVITDVRMSGISGLNLLKHIKQYYPFIEVIIMTAYGNIEDAVLAMKDGAYDYITKPIDIKKIRIVLRNCLAQQDLRLQNKELKEKLKKTIEDQIIGEHPSIKAIFNVVEQIAASDTTVLIQGESGTGKELIARAIHNRSLRALNPFIAVNCGAIPETLLESELFGYEKGAFTGASIRQAGKIELAQNGTLFLDEISTMSFKSQVNLLRVLEEHKIRRLGGNDLIQVNARFIAASNIILKNMVIEEKFREDLYYRLNVVPIFMPPLRERKSDIPLLIEYYLKLFCQKHERERKIFSQQALEILTNHNWPGNIRELKNIIERLVVTITAKIVDKHHLPEEIRSPLAKDINNNILTENTVQDMEYLLIKQTLEKFSGHREKTAKALGISLRTLQYKIKKYGF
ncbi:MAG: sigma-54-dependent Fis family transcriptional regulator [Candidatus Firestonebacteria bacterium]|nr:sigma-54-dependent Fis family transcriptional regulator [Candidatus Firestonebacteria bacterium]